MFGIYVFLDEFLFHSGALHSGKYVIYFKGILLNLLCFLSFHLFTLESCYLNSQSHKANSVFFSPVSNFKVKYFTSSEILTT